MDRPTLNVTICFFHLAKNNSIQSCFVYLLPNPSPQGAKDLTTEQQCDCLVVFV